MQGERAPVPGRMLGVGTPVQCETVMPPGPRRLRPNHVASAADEHPPPVLNNAYVPKSSPRRLFSSTMFAGVATALLLLGLLLWQMYLSAGPMGAVSICLAASLGVAVGRTQTL